MSEADIKQIKSKRVRMLVLSALALLFLGLIYGFSMFAKPMMQDFGLEGVGISFNVMMMAFCTGCVCSTFVERAIGVRGSLIATGIMFAIGFCGTGLLCARAGVGILYGCYAVIGGLGVGIGYNAIISTVNVWFPDKVGISSGILLLGFGISSLVCGNAALALRETLGGMSGVLTAVGIAGAIVAFALSFEIKKAPSNIVALFAPEKLDVTGAELGEGENMLKTPIFYIFYIGAIIIVAVGLSVIGSAASDASMLGASDGFGALLVGLISTINGLARVILGLVVDKFTIKTAAKVSFTVAVCATAMIVIAFWLDILWLYCIGAMLCGFSYGGNPVLGSTFSRKRYGSKNYSFNLGVINFAIMFGSLLNVLLMAVIGSANRMGVFIGTFVLAAIAFALVFVFCKMWKRDVESVES